MHSERLTSWLAHLGPGVKVVLWLLFGLVLILGVWLGYRSTDDNTFPRELVMSGLGAVLTVMSAAAVAFVALFSELRRVRERRTLTRFSDDSWLKHSIRVGRMQIPGIVVVAASNRDREWTSSASVEFLPFTEPRTTPSEVSEHREAILPTLLKNAQDGGAVITDEPCVDLVSAKIELRRNEQGRREPRFVLTPATASYFDFLGTTANLDATIDSGRSLREISGIIPQSLSDVSRLPAMAKIGCGTAVVTSDERLVLGVRGRTVIAGSMDASDERHMVHIVAEGMLPTDLDVDGRLNPRETSLRGMAEELAVGLRSHDLASVLNLIDTGFYFDQLRWQPCFAFLARIDQTWDELQTSATTAQDYWEVERLLSLPFDIRHAGIRQLLLGTHPDLVLASNHAASVVWFALLYKHGFSEMRDQLTQR